MKIHRKVKIAFFTTLGVAIVLFGILVYHIANARPIENASIQVSRIDFDHPFDSLQTIQIKEKLHSIPGVKSEIIVKNNIVVYFHDNTVADSKKIFAELMTKGDYKAQRFIVPANLANAQVCPVMDRDGYKYKFAKFVQSVFN